MNRIHPLYVWHGDHAAINKRLATVTKGDIVILNPSNGPRPDDEFERAAVSVLRKQCSARGATVLGYLYLDYGDRPYVDVFEDMEVWQSFGVLRFFFDNTPTSISKFVERRLVGGVQGSVHTGIRSVFNIGTLPMSGWEPDIGNLAVTWEGPSVDFPRRQWRVWEAALAYGVPEPLGRRNDGPLWQGWTSDTMPNPWDGEP